AMPSAPGARDARRNPLRGRGPVSRRRFLELLAGAGAGALVLPHVPGALAGTDGPAVAPPLPPGYVPSFPDAVIAGDPLPDGSGIGTCMAPAAGGAQVPVLWEVSPDPGFATVAAGGTVTTEQAGDWTAKVLVDGLGPDRWYHYRFVAGATSSPVGRL